MQAINIIYSLKCPSCEHVMAPFDGSKWSLDNLGWFAMECPACGYAYSGNISIDNVSTMSPVRIIPPDVFS